jgi:L-arabinose transport system ATP-binding protein
MSNSGLYFDAVSRQFPGVRALDNVSFAAAPGSVHALMGENGAGKSTLLKILSGVYRPDGGCIVLNGVSHVFTSTADAIAAGVAVIYQELHLVAELSVAENLFLGHLPRVMGIVKRQELVARSTALLRDLGEAFPATTKVSKLSIAQRQMVEIAKALSREAQVIAFDEPTSSLSSREAERLFKLIARLKGQGKIILYVSHRMNEIYKNCDAATVLRDGKHVETFASLQDVSPDTLVTRMVGRAIDDVYHYRPRAHGGTALSVRGLMGRGVKEPLSLEVKKGEILGIFGLVGAGRSEMLRLIFGAERKSEGRVSVEGTPVAIGSPADAIRAGVVFCPEDRKKDGIVPVRSIMENINISGRRHFAPLKFFIAEWRERRNADKFVKMLRVKTLSIFQLISKLSGGNQQKVVLARWLSEQVKVILLDEPTRGIDVGAKSEIYEIIYRLAEDGVGVILVSSELPEVLGVSDRIAVMRQGRISGMFDRSEATEETVLMAALPVGPTGTAEGEAA